MREADVNVEIRSFRSEVHKGCVTGSRKGSFDFELVSVALVVEFFGFAAC